MTNQLPPLADGLDLILGLHLINVQARMARAGAHELRLERLFLRAQEKEALARELYDLKTQVGIHLMMKRLGLARVDEPVTSYVCTAALSRLGWHGFHFPLRRIGGLAVGLPRVSHREVKAVRPAQLPPGYTLPAVRRSLEEYLDSGRGALPILPIPKEECLPARPPKR